MAKLMGKLVLPEAWFLGPLGQRLHFAALNFGLSPSLLSIGSAVIVGLGALLAFRSRGGNGDSVARGNAGGSDA